MSKLCTLLSAMYLEDYKFIDALNIKSDAVIINQCDSDGESFASSDGRNILFISSTDRGLSRSRNLAIESSMRDEFSEDDICIFCDNDCVYVDGAKELIASAFERNPDADIIVFFIERKERHKPIAAGEKELSYVDAMKIFSPEIAFRKSSLAGAGLFMDERFGAGAAYGMGEENILLFDAIKKGLKVIYAPVKIAALSETESTWFKGYTDRYFINRGAGYRRMSRWLCPLLILQFAVRKRALYRGENSFFNAIRMMLAGSREIASVKRIFIVGDHRTGSGPANATKELLTALGEAAEGQRFSGRLLRLIELYIKVPRAGVIFLSGHSKQNLHAIRLARRHKKRVIFWMHGCVEHENHINGVPDEDMNRVEREVLRKSDLILAVSESFEGWLKESYPEYSDKISHLTNGIPVTLGRRRNEAGVITGDKKIRLISIGGGMPRKRISRICEATRRLCGEGYELGLEVYGARGKDSDMIDSYPFVNDHGIVSSAAMREALGEGGIYIQNSSFETFGLAPLEALYAGCSLLLSRQVGAIESFDEGALSEDDIIEDCEDAAEIAAKLRLLIKSPNHDRLIAAIDEKKHSWRAVAGRLIKICENDI